MMKINKDIKDIRLLDLFCGQGGCSMGAMLAGIVPENITGVDIVKQKRYPFKFIKSDAIEYAIKCLDFYDLIIASPPCKGYSVTKSLHGKYHPLLIKKTRDIISHKPYIIENVPGARLDLINPIRLCGTMFDLRVIRHRYFESNMGIYAPGKCNHRGKASGIMNYDENGNRIRLTLENYQYLTICGKAFPVEDAKIAMGIDWMSQAGLSQAIPPAYMKWLLESILFE